MSRIVDDDPPIKTHPASAEYRANYDRIFGEKGAVLETCGCDDATVRNCPYASEINDDNNQRCKCCDNCAHECAMDV